MTQAFEKTKSFIARSTIKETGGIACKSLPDPRVQSDIYELEEDVVIFKQQKIQAKGMETRSFRSIMMVQHTPS